MRIKLAISVVIGTDCIGSCKSNYHMNPATTAPILHGDAFYNIKRKIYKKDFAELPFVNVVFVFDRMVMIYTEFVIFSLFAMHLDYCNIQRVYDQLDRNSHCLHIHKLYFNASKLYQKWEKLPHVCHIYNVFKFKDIPFLHLIIIYSTICCECLAFTINIMLCYL